MFRRYPCFAIAPALILLPLSLSGCGGAQEEPPPILDHEARSTLLSFNSCQDLVQYTKTELTETLEALYRKEGVRIHREAEKDRDQDFDGDDDDIDEEDAEGDDSPDGPDRPLGEAQDGSSSGAVEPKSGGAKSSSKRREGAPSDSGEGAAPDHSKTNIQEQGVDEPDLVKTDGRRMFTLSGGVLRIADLTGAQTTFTDRLQLMPPNEKPRSAEMLIHDNRLLVVHHRNKDLFRTGAQGNPGARIQEIDISTPGQAKVMSELDVEGRYISARKVGSVIRLVTSSAPKGINLLHPYDVEDEVLARIPKKKKRLGIWRKGADSEDTYWEHMVAAVRPHNASVIAAITEQNLLPRFRFRSLLNPEQNREGLLYGCEQTLRPGLASGLEMLSVITIDLAKGITPDYGTGILARGTTVYANDASLYVATRGWAQKKLSSALFPKWDQGDEGEEDEGVDVDDESERVESSAMQADAASLELRQATLKPSTSSRYTYLHKFDISGAENAKYRASGFVDGDLLNQFAMSEHQGVLRVAATRYDFGERVPVDSLVATFQEQAGRLVELGRAQGLGQTESIRSVRFMGDVGYVVTFRQTDPLYTLDLRNPSAPTVLGELKIEGFSAYLHPLQPGFLLGVGRDASPEGRLRGLQVSIFDVRDLRAPKRIHNYTLEGARSNIQWDHRAFLHWPKTQSLVVPIRGWDRSGDTGYRNYSRALLLGVDPVTGITLRRSIEHPRSVDVDAAGRHRSKPAQIERSVVVGERLWTLSDQGMKASTLTDGVDLEWVKYE